MQIEVEESLRSKSVLSYNRVQLHESVDADMSDENAKIIRPDSTVGLPVQRHSDSISLCVTPSEEPSNVDINSNLSNSSEMFADRCRRRSSRLANLKSDLIANGACFRPPFTPSNSFTRCDGFTVSPRGSIIELDSSSEMRSSSVRPNSRTSSTSGSRAPSLPPVPKSRKYAHVQSRTVNRTDYQKPESQVRITHKPLKIEAKSKVGSLVNIQHTAGGGNKKIPQQKLNFKERAQPRIESHMSLHKLNSKEPTPRSPTDTTIQNSSSLAFDRQ